MAKNIDPIQPIPARESNMKRPALDRQAVEGMTFSEPVETLPIPLQILANAYRLNMGTRQERAEALESLSTLVFALKHSQHTPNPNKERT